MLKTTFAVLLALTLTAGAATHNHQSASHTVAAAPAAPTPAQPVETTDPGWDDTADTSDEMNETLLEIDTDSSPDVHLETDLRNNVHSPLLENDQIKPADPAPTVDPLEESHDPMVDPAP